MSEKGEAARDGAQLQRNSGRGLHDKGDAILGSFLLDYKEYAKGFTVTLGNWAKLSTDAWKVRRKPAFRLVLGDDEARVRLWVFDDRTGREMMELWEEKYGE